jgi:hypothetical protein
VRPASVMPASMAIFDLLQFEALLVRKTGSNFPVRFRHDLVDAPAGVPSYFFQLRGRFIDDWRYFGNLFWRQTQLRAEPVPHSDPHQSGMMKFKEQTSCMHLAKESTRHSAGDKDENETGD